MKQVLEPTFEPGSIRLLASGRPIGAGALAHPKDLLICAERSAGEARRLPSRGH